MRKKLIVWLLILVVLFSSISIYANTDEENITGTFFIKNIVVDGKRIVNNNLQYPFFIYNNTTYLPVTEGVGQICGFIPEVNWESRTVKILKTEPTRDSLAQDWLKTNQMEIPTQTLTNASAIAYRNIESDENAMTDSIVAPKLEFEAMDLNGMPVLVQDKTVFMPAKAFTDSEIFNWDIYFNEYYGLCISTKEGIAAQTYMNQDEYLENVGLTEYILANNYCGMSRSLAQNYVFFFKRAAEVYSTDKRVIMAIAKRESHFNTSAVGSSGSVGIMQVLPSTGRGFGLTLEQLYDPRINIDFGTMYVSERVKAYEGDWIRGLSAYNQGSARVNRGNHSTVYANRVLNEYYALNEFLTVNGYIK